MLGKDKVRPITPLLYEIYACNEPDTLGLFDLGAALLETFFWSKAHRLVS